jgi:TM2 domain-containing membrane protein YozV
MKRLSANRKKPLLRDLALAAIGIVVGLAGLISLGGAGLHGSLNGFGGDAIYAGASVTVIGVILLLADGIGRVRQRRHL